MNCILYKKDTDEIIHLIKDCIQEGNNFIGSNKKMLGVKTDKFDIIWTEEEILASEQKLKDNENVVIKIYSKKPSEIAVAERKTERHKITHVEKVEAIEMRQTIDFINIDTLIEGIKDMEDVKSFLKDLSKVILGVIKIQDR